MPKPILTSDALYEAAGELANSETGRNALRGLAQIFAGSSLDLVNQRAVLTLLEGKFGAFAGTATDAVREALRGRATEGKGRKLLA